jgi:hypothetical protein
MAHNKIQFCLGKIEFSSPRCVPQLRIAPTNNKIIHSFVYVYIILVPTNQTAQGPLGNRGKSDHRGRYEAVDAMARIKVILDYKKLV